MTNLIKTLQEEAKRKLVATGWAEQSAEEASSELTLFIASTLINTAVEELEKERKDKHDNLIAHPDETGEEWEHHDPRWNFIDISASVAESYNAGVSAAQNIIKGLLADKNQT